MTTKADRISALIRSIGFAQRATADEWVRTTGLTRQQAFTLGYIEENQHRGVIARELAEMSGTTAASVTSLLQGLEERGFISRMPSPEDSRVKLITVTAEGSRLIDGFDDEMTAATVQLFAALSAEEQDQLIGLLERITESADAPIIQPPDRKRRTR
jgi:MarR family transcriptional repressor of mepA